MECGLAHDEDQTWVVSNLRNAFMFDGRYEIKAYLQKFIYGASENSRASMTIFSRLLARQRVPLIM